MRHSLGVAGVVFVVVACSSSDAAFSPVSSGDAGQAGDASHAGTSGHAGGDGPESGGASANTSAGGDGAGGRDDSVPSAGAAGTASEGGSTGGEGAAGGDAGQTWGGEPGGGAAGSAGHCLENWQGSRCDTCSDQEQSDRAACAQVLACYLENDCGPDTCSGDLDVCGVNAIGAGRAPFAIATAVYACRCSRNGR